ncbi:M14 family metallopeptidase [Bowmanella denitrificans]|uniref:M14 family metallopeptidase n=1 Tax=Bowmanella denitrificans TaxID=366582 RepID=UPI000C9CF0DC|nr:M14 family metallocarboxypeptidase [Bowmanella denitrificans]
MNAAAHPYPIGTPGTPWNNSDKQQWLALQSVKRSYQTDVVQPLETMQSRLALLQYGQLQYGAATYPLFALKSAQWQSNKPVALITGGVHGYETSGVHGALRFAQAHADDYAGQMNLLIVPCISPWGYETINRWNPSAIDPNRSFYAESPAGESAALIKLLGTIAEPILLHIDLHETTDTDNSEFRPALAARDGTCHDNWNIPDGFYLVGDSHKAEADFQRAVLDAVEKVTHIADADENNRLIGSPLVQHGVVNYDTKKLGLCAGVTDARWVTTTEVYPDSDNATPEQCIVAQVAAIQGALGYMLRQMA